MIAGYVLARVAEGKRHEHDHVDGHAHAHAHGEQHAHEHAPVQASGKESGRPFAGKDERPFVTQVLGHFDELLYHVGAWTVVGLLAAAYLQATVSNGSLSMLSVAGVDIVLVTFLAVPSYVCAASATPLAAVLLAKGVSQGAVLTGLLLGPATNVATVAWLKAAYGARAAFYGLAALVLTTWIFAALANVYLPAPVLAVDAAHEHSHGTIAYACATLLVLLLARAVWRNGLRVWLGSLGEAMGHDHAHDHAH
jgi:uncharacterized membrane protein YraQ (UPF0718 family)